jgi:hypothetical protein
MTLNLAWFLDMIPKAQKKKTLNFNFKNLCSSKDTINTIKRQPSEWEKEQRLQITYLIQINIQNI